jgi:CRISPR-associated exonuclease Cas4
MKSEYSVDELLPLSGIQHFYFCRRQWALIHIERQWQENRLTAEGRAMHDRADDPFFSEMREGKIIARAMPIASYRLGLTGVCDVVEFVPSSDGICLQNRRGTYRPIPVEYKRGKEKKDACDEVQLCAQAICLEEMLSIDIPQGYFFYGEVRRRVEVLFTEELRVLVQKISGEMHQYFERGYTPQVKPSKACQSCSLQDICLPTLQKNTIPASKYIKMQIDED